MSNGGEAETFSLVAQYVDPSDSPPQEECEDLWLRVKEELLKRPNCGLEAKARVLHEDINKNWLARELAKFDALIDRSNEKGWHKEALTLSDYLDSRNLLRSPEEQSRLLAKMPKVIADELEVGPTTTTDSYQEIARETEDPPTITSGRSFGMTNFVGSSDAEPLIQIPNNKVSTEFWLPVLAKEPKGWSTIDQNQPKVDSGIDENGSAHTGVRVNQLVENSNYEERPLLEAHNGLEATISKSILTC